MAKYKVEVGGFVSSFRQKNLIIYTKNEEEAKEKGRDKFCELSQQKQGNMVSFEDTQVDNVILLD